MRVFRENVATCLDCLIHRVQKYQSALCFQRMFRNFEQSVDQQLTIGDLSGMMGIEFFIFGLGGFSSGSPKSIRRIRDNGIKGLTSMQLAAHDVHFDYLGPG